MQMSITHSLLCRTPRTLSRSFRFLRNRSNLLRFDRSIPGYSLFRLPIVFHLHLPFLFLLLLLRCSCSVRSRFELLSNHSIRHLVWFVTVDFNSFFFAGSSGCSPCSSGQNSLFVERTCAHQFRVQFASTTTQCTFLFFCFFFGAFALVFIWLESTAFVPKKHNVSPSNHFDCST